MHKLGVEFDVFDDMMSEFEQLVENHDCLIGAHEGALLAAVEGSGNTRDEGTLHAREANYHGKELEVFERMNLQHDKIKAVIRDLEGTFGV